jgi:Fe-S-cluster-containing hydrogenase component 2
MDLPGAFLHADCHDCRLCHHEIAKKSDRVVNGGGLTDLLVMCDSDSKHNDRIHVIHKDQES